MATNFENHKDDLIKNLERLSDSKRGLCNGKIGSVLLGLPKPDCSKTNCAGCLLQMITFLAQEHKEAPKLSKMERAFCEIVGTGAIARDKDGQLYWFTKYKKIEKRETIWGGADHVCLSYLPLPFNFIKWQDEKPWAVEDLLKLEVE